MTELFDKSGRCIPGPVSAKVQQKVRRYFRCDPPKYDLQDIFQRSNRYLGQISLGFDQFTAQVAQLQSKLQQDPGLSNLLHGPMVPFLLPRKAPQDIGEALEQDYLPAVAAAFNERFPDYAFVDHNKVALPHKLLPVPGCGHAELLQTQTEQDLVGLYFPALDGYSLEAARQQLAFLPEGFSLAGAADSCAALVACPELLLREDGYAPLLWLGALESDDPNEGFHFEAYGYNLNFNRRMHLGNADEYWANGLVFSQRSQTDYELER